MKNNRLSRLMRQCVEVVGTLLVVLAFFGLFTTLLFKIFPSGISLTQMVQRGSGSGGDNDGDRGAMLDAGGMEGALGEGQRVAATLSVARNEVKSKRAESIAWGTARSGMALYSRDAVQTFKESSAQISFDRQNSLTLGSNSLVIIKRMEKDILTNERRTVMVVVDGELKGRVGAGGENPLNLEIATPNALARVLNGKGGDRKTDFRISINPDQSSTIVVLKGEAEVSAKGKTVRVGENRGVTVKPGEAPRAAVPLPTAPGQSAPADGSVIPYRELSPKVRFAWAGKQGGETFHFQLAQDPEFKKIVTDRRLTGTEFIHGNLKQGVYYWRVSGIDDGREGRISGARRVEIRQDLDPPPLQVTFPSGAVTEERFVLTGSTEPGARLFVAGKGISVSEAGTFTTEVTIRPGMNLVAVEAVDGAGNVTYRSHYVQGRF